jgi:hypothetical protein
LKRPAGARAAEKNQRKPGCSGKAISFRQLTPRQPLIPKHITQSMAENGSLSRD